MNINTLILSHQNYPSKLQAIFDPPKKLHYLGALADKARPTVAIVGSRKCTAYGKQTTYDLAYALAKSGISVVSGLAIGVDAIAHQAALDAGGHTVAVMACGLHDIYPRRNRQLARHILARDGAIISEYSLGTPVMKHQFIARNRLIAGLSDAVVVTEAAVRSGSLSTAQFALEQGRPVMAVPGNITQPASAGTNGLIKQGAALVHSIDDIFHELGFSPIQPDQPVFNYSDDETAIVTLMQQGITDGDDLQRLSKLPPRSFHVSLSTLELAGAIRNIGTNTWTLA